MATPNIGTNVQPGERSWALSWGLAALMTGVTILSARVAVYIPPTPVPVTLQVFAVLLTGLLLGRRWSVVAQAQYLALGAAGLHVFAKGDSGIPTLFGLTGGYLLSYPIAACVTGWIADSSAEPKWRVQRQLLGCAAGLAVIYALGCSWFAAYSHRSLFAAVLPGALIFLPWDAVKALAAVATASGLSALKGRSGREDA